MKRPALTWKVIRNLEELWGYAEGEIATVEDNGCVSWSNETKPAREAIEWIKRLRRWKTEQDEKKKEAK